MKKSRFQLNYSATSKSLQNSLFALGGLGVLSILAEGCSSSNTASTTSKDLTVSGTISATSSASTDYLAEEPTDSLKDLHDAGITHIENLLAIERSGHPIVPKATNITGYTVSCTAKTSPPTAFTGTVGSDGTFSVKGTSAVGVPFSCDLLDTSKTVVASFIYTDSSKKDMAGNAQAQDSPPFKSDTAKLGSISYDSATGEVTVDASKVVDSSGSAAIGTSSAVTTPFDPTGTWEMSDVDFTLPTGFRALCKESETADSTGNKNDRCQGPQAKMFIFFNRLTGTKTSDNSTIYGLQVWTGQSAAKAKASFTNCGSMTGLSSTAASALGISFANNTTATSGAFTFTSSVTDRQTNSTATITDFYKLSTATSRFEMQNCGPATATIGGKAQNGWKCTDASGNYQINLAGGCVNSAGKAVQPKNDDWSSMKSASWSESSLGSGFYKSTATGTMTTTAGTSTSVTCTSVYGTFDSTGAAIARNKFKWDTITKLISKDANCSTGATDLVKAQCYANYYFMSGLNDGGASSGCFPRINTDWSQTDATKFITIDFKPAGLALMDQMTYADTSTATLLTKQVGIRGAAVQNSDGQQQYIPCGVIDKGGLTVKKVTDNKLLVTYVSALSTSSTNIPACVSEFGSKTDKFMFYLTK